MSSWVDVVSVSKNNSIFSNVKSFEQASSLGKDEFLKILMTQLSNQDPSSPLQDKEFIAQMATFSSLEQMTNLNSSFQKFANLQMGQYSSTIGKEITWTQVSANGVGEQVSGVVKGISVQDGNYYYLVGDNKIPMEYVTEIKQSNPETESVNKEEDK